MAVAGKAEGERDVRDRRAVRQQHLLRLLNPPLGDVAVGRLAGGRLEGLAEMVPAQSGFRGERREPDILLNDARNENTAALQKEINKLPGIEKFTYKPIVTCGEVDDEAARYFNETKLIPSFSFIDPFGYKGLSLNITKGVIDP